MCAGTYNVPADHPQDLNLPFVDQSFKHQTFRSHKYNIWRNKFNN